MLYFTIALRSKESTDKWDGVFVFPVDADDFVNNKCAAYVKEHPGANGFKSKKVIAGIKAPGEWKSLRISAGQ